MKVLIVDDNAELAGLLAAAVESRGFQTTVAHSGAEAQRIVASDRLSLGIIDLLLPDMRGTEVLRALANAKVPAVAMTGVYKGARFAQEAQVLYGAKAFFEKPFDTKGLLEAVSRHALAVAAAVPAPKRSEAEELALDEVVDDDEIVPLVEEVEEADVGPTAATPHAAPEVEIVVEPAVVQPAPAPKPPPPSAEETKAAAKPSTAPELAAADLPFADRKVWTARHKGLPRGVELRSGSLGMTSIARLLTAVYQGRQAGEMRLRRREAMKLLCFDAGFVVYAASNLETERFGAVATRAGLLTTEGHHELRAAAKAAGKTTAALMKERGLMTGEQHLELVEQQVREIVWSMLDWADGEYGFAGAKLPPGLLPVRLHPARVVMEGVRRNVPLVKLREFVPRDALFVPRPDPPYDLQDIGFSGDEARVLAYADGTKTADDLMMLTEVDERVVLSLLHAARLVGLLEPRSGRPMSRKIVFT